MRTYVLGLKNDFRGNALVEQCRSLGLSPEVYFGLDARTTRVDEVLALASEAASRFAIDRPLSPPEIACVLGHQQIRRMFLEEGDEFWALVLEDDANLPSSVEDVVKALTLLPNKPIVVTLLGIPSEALTLGSVEMDEGRRLRQLLDPPDYAVAYFINAKAAKVAVEAYVEHPIDSVPDWPYRWSRDVQFWAVDPPLAGIKPMESLLEGQRRILQSAATKRISPELQHFLLTLTGLRLIRGLRLGYSPTLVWRHDVVAPVRRRLKRLAARGGAGYRVDRT